MGRARFTCEYCNKSFEDSQDARRRHNSGRAHKANVKLWYDSFQGEPLVAVFTTGNRWL